MSSAPTPPYSLVVADDDADYRLLVRLSVSAEEALTVVGEAAGAEEAVARAAELRPDLLLLDAALPGLGPVAVAGEVARVAPYTVVILTSAWPGGEPLGSQGARLPVLSKGTPPATLAGHLLSYLESSPARGTAADVVAMAFPADLASVGHARRWVRAALEGMAGGTDDLVDLAMLLTSEVVTNSLVHGRSGVEVSIDRRADRIRIGVTDSDQAFIRRRAPAVGSQSGRGVELVESMSAGWGVNRFVSGKQVWFDLEVSG
jgi:CheY-like chemotaxis protein/anti-sigma regulatory factor (Ser/Thr protein kinase)